MTTQVYEIKPRDFKSTVEVAACYLEIDGRLLLLERAAGKSEAGKWGVPAGKLERGESPQEAAFRELTEETGIRADLAESLGSLYIRKSEIDFVYHLFKIALKARPEVQLSDEHPRYRWASILEIESLPLMDGELEALRYYRTALARRRVTACVSSYLLLRENDRVLLLLRHNTGYMDHHWGFAAGHVEPGESASVAMLREAKEEIGITVDPDDLRMVHVMHRKSNRLNIDVFFECTKWQGAIQNCEPDKCARVEFFPIDALPLNMMDYCRFALEAAVRGETYSERGFA